MLAMKNWYINVVGRCKTYYTVFRCRKRYIRSSNMKSIVLFFALVAAASAGLVVPQTYSYGLGLASPLAYSAPLAYSSPLAYSAPIAYSAPAVVAAPAIQSGYVAANRGAVHTAPLPEGPLAFSHHLNTAPAPGTL